MVSALARLAVIIALLLPLLPDDHSQQATSHSETDMAKKTSTTHTQKLLQAVPDGGSVTYEELKKAVGDDVAGLLSWTNPQRVARKGKHFTVENASKSLQSHGNASVEIDTKVEFDLDTNSADLAARNIKGIKVKLSSMSYALDVKEADISRDSKGNTKIKVKLLVSRFLPYIRHEVTIGPDGQPVE